MADILSRCVLFKGLPTTATVEDLKKCLEKRNLSILEAHSHTENHRDKRWVVLFSSSEVATDCIKKGSWKVNLPSGEVTVTPDYCSECIVPDEWIERYEVRFCQDSDEGSSNESFTILSMEDNSTGSCHSHSFEQPAMTPILGTQVHIADDHEKSLQLAMEDDSITILTEGSVYSSVMPQSDKIRRKDEKSLQKAREDDSATFSTQDALFSPDLPLSEEVKPKNDYVSSQSELVIPQSPQTVDQNRDYTPLKSGSIPLSTTQMTYTSNQSQTGLKETVSEDADYERIQTKTYKKSGTISLSAKNKRGSSLPDKSFACENIENDGKSGQGNGNQYLPSISSTDGIDEDDEEQIDIDERSYEDSTKHNESFLSPEKMPFAAGQGMQFPPQVMDCKASVDNGHHLTKAISIDRMAISKQQQQSIENCVHSMMSPQPLTEVPSQNMNMSVPNMRLSHPHAESVSAGQRLPQTSQNIQPPNMINPQPTTQVPMQIMNVGPFTPRFINSALLPGQLYPGAPGWPVMSGQVNSSGVSDLHGFQPGRAGPYPYSVPTMPSIPPGGHQNYGQIPWGQYPQSSFAAQHVLATSSHPPCPPPQASYMPVSHPLRQQVGSQPLQGYISSFEKAEGMVNQRSEVTQAGPVEEGSSAVNRTGENLIISKAEYVEKKQATDSQVGMAISQNPKMKKGDDLDKKTDRPMSQLYPKLDEVFSSLGSECHTQFEETEDTVSREIQCKPQTLNIQTPRMIRVMGLAKSVSLDNLEMFLENKKRCGGGEIERIEWGRNKKEAFVTFKDPSVVQSVLKKQEREPFYLDKMKLTVQEYFPPPTDPLRLFLTNLSPKVNRELLGLYLESRCKAIPTEILLGRKPGTALVSFSEPPDVEQLLRKVKEKALEGQYIEVTRVPVTQSVQVTGLDQTASRDTVEFYFENKKRSGGGPVTDVRYGRNKQSCVVLFENAEDAERVCKRPHTVDKQDIQVSLYYDCFDEDLEEDESCDVTQETEGRVGEFKLPDPVEVKDLNPQILKFLMKNEKHRQIFEKNLSDINGVVKWPSSLEGYVIIECTVKMEDRNVSLVIKDWNSRVVDKVKNFEAGIAVTEFNLIEITWSVVVKELQTITIDNPEDIGVFLEQEKYKITVVGPKADVEKLEKTLLDLINKVETQIKLEKQMVKETKSLKTYEITLLRASRFKEDIERFFPGLKFDLNSNKKIVTFVGQADIAQKAIAQMHKKLQSFVSGHMQISKPAKDLLWVEEIRHYIKQKMKSQNIIGVWDVVRREEVRMFGRDEEEVQKAIQLVKNCLLEKEILLDEIKQQAIQGQQWLQLVQSLQLKHNGKASINTTATLILVVALDSIFQDVSDEINSYLEKHSVQEIFLSLDPVRIKFIKAYKMEAIKVMEKKFESSAVQFSVIDYGDQKGIKIIGTKDGCKGAKTTLAEMAKNIITKEHIMVNKVGLTELLQSARGKDQLRSIASRWKCFIALKVSVTTRNSQLEGASAGYSSGSDDDSGRSYKSMNSQSSSSSQSGGTSTDVMGIKVSVVTGELVEQRVDVIVNSTSQNLDLNTGYISKTILKHGGATVQSECLQQYPNGIKPGQVVVTSGGNLNCKHVFHGCLPSYDGGQGNAIQLMQNFIITCLATADKNGIQSIAFPALGTGNLGFPADEVGNLMMKCITAIGKAGAATLKNVLLVVYPTDKNSLKAFTSIFGAVTAPSASIRRSDSSGSNISIGRGICSCSLPHSVILEIVHGDITKETTDVIVNSVLSNLNLTQGQVSKAILAAGGISIQQECQDKSPELKKSGFVITSAGQLPCKMIIHMAAQNKGPEWEDMMEKVLLHADKRKCQSITFPALGTGGKGMSTEEIAQVMYSASTEFAKSQPYYLKKIRVILFQETMLAIFVKAIKDHVSGQGKSRPIKGPAAVGKSSKERSESSSLVFSITIDSESNFKSAIMSLESFVKSEITEKEINSPRKIILELLDRQVTKMEGMGKGSTVVSVHRQKGVIHVSGTPKEVLETYESVMKYLHNIERDKMKAEQEKLKTQASSDLSLPRTWTSMAPNENMKCVTLNRSDKEYVTVSQKFLASAGGPYQQGVAYGRTGINYGSPGFTVINIERVQNKTLYIQYKAMKKQMETQNNGVANEKELWHGTAGNNIANINNNGFNRSYGGSGSHGAGTYFAVNASYSVSGYCNPDASGHRHIYLANVLTGDSIVAGSETRVLPPKDPSNPHITYDSTTDNTRNPQMFVIFHDTQAYPSYHITFR